MPAYGGGPPDFPPGPVGMPVNPPSPPLAYQAPGSVVVAWQPEGHPLAIRTGGRQCNPSHEVPNGTRLRVHFDPGPKDDMIQIVGFSGELPGWVKRKNVRLREATFVYSLDGEGVILYTSRRLTS